MGDLTRPGQGHQCKIASVYANGNTWQRSFSWYLFFLRKSPGINKKEKYIFYSGIDSTRHVISIHFIIHWVHINECIKPCYMLAKGMLVFTFYSNCVLLTSYNSLLALFISL
jgi:hypothetical protein